MGGICSKKKKVVQNEVPEKPVLLVREPASNNELQFNNETQDYTETREETTNRDVQSSTRSISKTSSSHNNHKKRKSKNRQPKPKEFEGGDPSKFIAYTLEKGVQAIKDEFSEIKTKTVCTKKQCFFFYLQANAPKNRYKDVQCCDNNRVVLKELSMGTDYIHANYCSSTKNPKRFICAQGALASTVADFWSMVWQEESEFVVMLCNFTEMGKAKCIEYFPVHEKEQFIAGNATLVCQTVTKETWPAQVTIRQITIDRADLQEKRTITHIHWESWPDRGVPPIDNSIFKLLDIVCKSSKPIVVHCSAGIGRTGTTVAIQIALELIESGNTLEEGLSSLLIDLRKQRASSVQNDQQYLFVHRILLHKYMTEDDKHNLNYVKFCVEYDKATLA